MQGENILYEEYEDWRICEFIRRIRNDFKKMGEERDPRSEEVSIWAAVLYGDECFRGYRYGSSKFEEPFGYIYLTECEENHKKYIGQHAKSKFDPKYYGSGIGFCEDIDKGIIRTSNMDRIVLDWAYSLNELNEKERFWIEFFDAYKSDMFYNRNKGGQFGLCYAGCTFTEEHKKKISEARKGYKHTKESKLKMSANQVRKYGVENHFYGKHHTKETREKISKALAGKLSGEKNPMYGKHHTPEAVEKCRLANKGRVYSKVECDKRRERMLKYYKTHESPMKGKKHSEETLKKMSNSRKGRKFTETHKRNLSNSLKDKAKTLNYVTSKKVLCVNTGEIFKSTNEANRYIKSVGIKGSVYDAFREGRMEGVVGGLTWKRIT